MIMAILAGIVSGIISGMGIGGGAVLIPVLVFGLKVDQHVAQSINLLYFIPTAIMALVIHIKNKRIDFKVAATIVIFGILGAVVGSRLAVALSSDVLRKIFGVFLFTMGIHEFLRK